jgi:ElaA protein
MKEMDILFKSFDELQPKQLEQIYILRQQVFIIEQTCFYEDIDGRDDQAHHLQFYKDNKLVAYLRLFKKGVKYKNEANLGRIVVAPAYRGKGMGPELIKKGIELCEGDPVRIEAQAALIKYYKTLGFKPEGKIYEVDGIDHIQMVLSQ